MSDNLQAALNPKSIAVVGASDNPHKSEFGLAALNLKSEDEVGAAFDARFGPVVADALVKLAHD